MDDSNLSINSLSVPPPEGRSNKISLALIMIGTFACVVTLMVSNRSAPQNKFIVNLAYNDGKTQIMTSTRHMSICSKQADNKQNPQIDFCKHYNTTQDIVVTRSSSNSLRVYVLYRSIQETLVDLLHPSEQKVEEMFNTNKENDETFTEREIYLIFKAKISNKGKLIRLESANGKQPDIFVRLTERLIEQTFPEIDSKLYESPEKFLSRDRKIRLLGSEEAKQILHSQDTYLGEVLAEYTIQSDHDKVKLSKDYTDYDFLSFDYNLGGDLPDINFHSETMVNEKMQITENTESMLFDITEPTINNEADTAVELIGLISVHVDSSMKVLENRETDDSIFLIIKEFEDANLFEEVDLDSDGGFINKETSVAENETADPDARFLAGKNNLVSEHEASVFQNTILNNHIEFKMIQQNYGSFSVFLGALYLNSDFLTTFFETEFFHDWIICPKIKKLQNFPLKKRIFTIIFPVLGFVKVSVSANIFLDSHLNFSLETKNEKCNFDITASFDPQINAEGGLSAAYIIEGGISFGGSIANSSLSFHFEVIRRTLDAYLSISFQQLPSNFTIDVYFSYFSCDIHELWYRRLGVWGYIEKGFNHLKNQIIKVINACGQTTKTFNIAQGELGETIEIQIYSNNFSLKRK